MGGAYGCLWTDGDNRFSGESDNDVESINNDEFFDCLFIHPI